MQFQSIEKQKKSSVSTHWKDYSLYQSVVILSFRLCYMRRPLPVSYTHLGIILSVNYFIFANFKRSIRINNARGYNQEYTRARAFIIYSKNKIYELIFRRFLKFVSSHELFAETLTASSESRRFLSSLKNVETMNVFRW